jgi:hypothetical protein
MIVKLLAPLRELGSVILENRLAHIPAINPGVVHKLPGTVVVDGAAALKELADEAGAVEHDDVEGYPFDSERSVLAVGLGPGAIAEEGEALVDLEEVAQAEIPAWA